MQCIWIDGKTEGQRLNKLLGRYLDAAPQSFIYKMFRKKNIKLNHKKAEGNEIVRAGDVVELFLADDTIIKFRHDGTIPTARSKDDLILSAKVKAVPGDIIKKQECISGEKKITDTLSDMEILYEDTDVLIVNKPVGMLSQKAKAEDYSLNERIVNYYHLKDGHSTFFTPSVCNRLDRNTSGIMLAGMSLKGTQELSRLLRQRKLDKYYLTIVCGRIERAKVIKGYLAKQQNHNTVRIYENPDDARQAGEQHFSYIETIYEPILTGQFQKMWFTLLKVKLVTGKPHQIRAHLDCARHPVIGDGKYGLKTVNALMKREFGLKNQLLHAYRLVFPVEDCALEQLAGKVFYADLPERFKRIAEKIFGEKYMENCKLFSESDIDILNEKDG